MLYTKKNERKYLFIKLYALCFLQKGRNAASVCVWERERERERERNRQTETETENSDKGLLYFLRNILTHVVSIFTAPLSTFSASRSGGRMTVPFSRHLLTGLRVPAFPDSPSVRFGLNLCAYVIFIMPKRFPSSLRLFPISTLFTQVHIQLMKSLTDRFFKYQYLTLFTITSVLLQRWLWHSITHKGWYPIKQRNWNR